MDRRRFIASLGAGIGAVAAAILPTTTRKSGKTQQRDCYKGQRLGLFNDDGTEFYVIESPFCYRYELTTPYDWTTAIFVECL